MSTHSLFRRTNAKVCYFLLSIPEFSSGVLARMSFLCVINRKVHSKYSGVYEKPMR